MKSYLVRNISSINIEIRGYLFFIFEHKILNFTFLTYCYLAWYLHIELLNFNRNEKLIRCQILQYIFNSVNKLSKILFYVMRICLLIYFQKIK